MTVAEFIEEIRKWGDDDLEIFTIDNHFDPTGVQPINGATELLDGFDKVVGIVII